jgi:hypothetical protein
MERLNIDHPKSKDHAQFNLQVWNSVWGLLVKKIIAGVGTTWQQSKDGAEFERCVGSVCRENIWHRASKVWYSSLSPRLFCAKIRLHPIFISF